MMCRPPARHHLLVVLVAIGLGLREDLRVDLGFHLRGIEAALVQELTGEADRIAAELDVSAAAGHVGGDGDGTGTARLGHDGCFLLMELGVEHLVLHAALLERPAQRLALLHRGGAHEHGAARRLLLCDLVDDGVELGLLVAEDQVREVLTDHGQVRGDGHHFQLVDLVELLLLGHGRTGHAGELVVLAEVVLEGDRGHGHRLALDAHALLGLDSLVEALGPASTRHLAAGELVHDDDLVVLDDVVAVTLVERVRTQRLLEVPG